MKSLHAINKNTYSKSGSDYKYLHCEKIIFSNTYLSFHKLYKNSHEYTRTYHNFYAIKMCSIYLCIPKYLCIR